MMSVEAIGLAIASSTRFWHSSHGSIGSSLNKSPYLMSRWVDVAVRLVVIVGRALALDHIQVSTNLYHLPTPRLTMAYIWANTVVSFLMPEYRRWPSDFPIPRSI